MNPVIFQIHQSVTKIRLPDSAIQKSTSCFRNKVKVSFGIYKIVGVQEEEAFIFFCHLLGFEIISLYSGLHFMRFEIINLIFRKNFKLCNPKANNTSEKRLTNYIIRKLILCIENTSRLCNMEANHKMLPDYIIRKRILDLEKDFQIM